MTNSHRLVNLSQTRAPSRACDHTHTTTSIYTKTVIPTLVCWWPK